MIPITGNDCQDKSQCPEGRCIDSNFICTLPSLNSYLFEKSIGD